MNQRSESLADKVYVELVRSLYWNMMPAVIMAGAFAISVALIHREVGDGLLLAIGIAGILASLSRLAVTRLLRGKALTAPLDRRQARQIQTAFAVRTDCSRCASASTAPGSSRCLRRKGTC